MSGFHLAHPFLAGLLLLGSAPSGSPEGAAAVLSEDDAVRLALERSEELSTLELALREQEQRAGSAGYAIDNPELRLRDVSTKYAYEDENTELQVGLRWRPPRLGELGVREQKEIVRLWKRRVEVEALKLELVTRVRKTYARVAMLQERVLLTDRQAHLREQKVAVVERLVALGERQILDQVRAYRRLLKSHSEASAVRQRLADARETLGALTGAPRVAVAPLPQPQSWPVDLERLSATAMARRAEARLETERARLVEAEYRAERYRLIPWFSFIEIAYHAESEKRDWGELVVGIDLPLFNWNLGEIRATSIARQGAETAGGAAIESIERQIREAVFDHRRAVGQWQAVEPDAEVFLPRAEKLLEDAREQTALPADDVLDLELACIETRQLLLEARFRVIETMVDLDRAVGTRDWHDGDTKEGRAKKTLGQDKH